MTATVGAVLWLVFQSAPPSASKTPVVIQPSPVGTKPQPPQVPQADNEGLKWTDDDLMDYLEKRGLEFEAVERAGGVRGVWLNSKAGMGRVCVTRWPSADEAERALPDLGGPERLLWGRFTLSGEPSPFLDEICSALDLKPSSDEQVDGR
jgi:hypothetical protein